MPQFIVKGGKPLNGEVRISGSKNAALPILAATLLTDQECVIKNVPDIDDIHNMLAILRSFGSEVSFKNHVVRIRTPRINKNPKDPKMQARACKMRASVLLLGPLLARTGYAKMPYPGGCILGARPIDTHTDIFTQFGVTEVPSPPDEIIFKGRPNAKEIVMPEFSVTGTENALMAAAGVKGGARIRLAALEPHVQDLCYFLKKMGCFVSGIGSHTVTVRAPKKLKGVTYTITPDYLEAGTFVIAGVLTRGTLKVTNIIPEHLDAFWNLLKEMKIPVELGKNYALVRPVKKWKVCKRLQTNVYPGFPTDLQPPFVVLLTQAEGKSFLHETLFEGRFNYFPEVIKMGAKIKKLNSHEAILTGPTKLLGGEVKSWDIRAGAAMILAALAAKGTTVVSDIQYIDRGYEALDQKLRKLGANIERS